MREPPCGQDSCVGNGYFNVYIMSKSFYSKIFLSILPCLLLAGRLDAKTQRTSSGTVFVSAMTGTTFSAFGIATLDAGVYTPTGIVKGSVSMMNIAFGVRGSEGEPLGRITFAQSTFGAGYLWRILDSTNRVFGIYGGGGLFIGMESVDPFGTFRKDAMLKFDKSNSFIYGLCGDASLEWFFLPRIVPNMAAVLGLRLPLTFGSQAQLFQPELSAGLRFNF